MNFDAPFHIFFPLIPFWIPFWIEISDRRVRRRVQTVHGLLAEAVVEITQSMDQSIVYRSPHHLRPAPSRRRYPAR